MKKMITMMLLVCSIGAEAQYNSLLTKTIQVKDSIKVGGTWYSNFAPKNSKSIFDIVIQGGADATGVVDCSGIIQTAINNGWKNIFIPKGNFKIASTVYFKDSVLVQGSGSASNFVIVGNIKAFFCRNKLGGNYCTFKNIAFSGSLALPISIYSYSMNMVDSGQSAIMVDTSVGVIVSESYFKNINGYAIDVRANSTNNTFGAYVQDGPRGNDIVNCNITRCFGGVNFTAAAEYNRYLGGTVNNSFYAHRQYLSGNNLVSNVTLSGNIYGAYVEGSSPWYTSNNGHGTITGCAINHNRTALWFKDVSWGFYLSNNMVYNDWDSIKFEGCDRIVIEGGYMTVNNGGKFYLNNNTKFIMNNVSDLLGITTSYAIVGEVPTIVKQDLEPGALTWMDVKFNKNFSIKHENGIVTTVGDEQFIINSKIKTNQPSVSGAGFWKLGKKLDATVALDTAKYIEVEIDGVIYKLVLVN